MASFSLPLLSLDSCLDLFVLTTKVSQWCLNFVLSGKKLRLPVLSERLTMGLLSLLCSQKYPFAHPAHAPYGPSLNLLRIGLHWVEGHTQYTTFSIFWSIHLFDDFKSPNARLVNNCLPHQSLFLQLDYWVIYCISSSSF